MLLQLEWSEVWAFYRAKRMTFHYCARFVLTQVAMVLVLLLSVAGQFHRFSASSVSVALWSMSFWHRSFAECRNGWLFLDQHSLDSQCFSSIVENYSTLRQLRLFMLREADSVLPALNLGARTLNNRVGRENWPRTRVGPLSAAWLTMLSSAWFSLTLKACELDTEVTVP